MTEIHNAQFIDDLDFDDTSIDCADLDNKWLDDIEKDNIDYAKFYKDDIYDIKVMFVYVDSNNAIYHVSSEHLELETKNTILQKEIVSIVNDKKKMNKKNYRVFKCYLYNLDIDPDDLHKFIANKYVEDNHSLFFRPVDLAFDVKINPTIAQFHTLNTLYLFMREKPSDKVSSDTGKRNTTKKVKRVTFQPDLKHTRRRYAN
jgi:hypothetical protein